MKHLYPGGRFSVFVLSVFVSLISVTPIQAQKIPVPITGTNQTNEAIPESMVRKALKENAGKLQFVENKGQEGLSPDVAGYFSSSNEIVFIEKNCLRILVVNKNGQADELHSPSIQQYRYNSFTIHFRGSTGYTGLEKNQPAVTRRNYIDTRQGNNRAISASSYRELILKNIYPGIDLRLYSQHNGQLEFDWIIAPGANPSQISMYMQGQQHLSLHADGSIAVHLGLGIFSLHLPESYYVTPTGKQPAPVRFIKKTNNEIGFTGFSKQKSNYPLVIDPDLLWGTFFDGAATNFDEYLYAIQYNYDNSRIYCAGAANMQVSTGYAAALSHTYDSVFADTTDALVYSLSNDGQFVLNITYLGGTNVDVATGISLSNSYVYVCGHTTSSDFPVTRATDGLYPAFDSVYHAGTDGFVAVFNLALDTLAYASFLGANGNDKALTVRATADSVFYISLSVKDTLGVASPNYIVNYADSIYAGNSEAWIGEFTAFSNLRFGTYVGGSSDDLINDFQVLSFGDVVFAGNTKNINEVNAYIPDNGIGQEALFGRIIVPPSGPVVFGIIDKIGGSNNDFAWGIYNVGDSVSILAGQTNSSDFPLGAGTPFQSTRAGRIDGFLAKVYNDGSSGYKATFTGGSDDDILVSVRPVVVNQQVALLGWGTTASTDLVTRNFNSGTFFSNTNSGNLDMVFVISNLDLNTKYYLSYIGGSANDYLGITGAPVGSNHLFYNEVDSVIYLGTTTHSSQTTHNPLFVGRGPADFLNSHVPVFDSTKNNSNNDTHVIIAISSTGLFALLPVKWESFDARLLADCSALITWSTAVEDMITRYYVQRSADGVRFETIGSVNRTDHQYSFTDAGAAGDKRVYYRVAAADAMDSLTYSPVKIVWPCSNRKQPAIYPSVVQMNFSVSGLAHLAEKNLQVEMTDVSGRNLLTRQYYITGDRISVQLPVKYPAGVYFVTIRQAGTTRPLATQRVLITN